MYNPIFGTGNGSAPVVNLTWPFIDKAHIQAKAGGVDVGITWTGPSQVKFNVPVPNGVPWQVERNTSRDTQLVDFENGSVLTEEDLDKANLQLLYVSQEITSLILRSDLENLLGLYDTLQTRMTGAEAAITGKAPIAHTHSASQITDFASAISGKSNVGHSHAVSDVTGLQTILDGKLGATSLIAGLNVNLVNNGNGTITISASGGGGGGGATLGDGNYGDVTVSGGGTIMTVTKVGGVAPSMPGHTHTIANVTGLQTALDGKATVVHSHAISDVTGLQAALDGKQAAGSYAAAGHTHSIANVTGLQGALDNKSAALLSVLNYTGDKTVGGDWNGAYARFIDTATKTITLDNGPVAGLSMILVNRSSVNLSLACSAGLYKNGATGTATTGTLAPGGRVTLIHEGSGVWTADGRGLS